MISFGVKDLNAFNGNQVYVDDKCINVGLCISFENASDMIFGSVNSMSVERFARKLVSEALFTYLTGAINDQDFDIFVGNNFRYEEFLPGEDLVEVK